MKNRLFFDTASTTQCSEAAAAELSDYCVRTYGNPNSAHGPGQEAAEIIHRTRRFFGNCFGVKPEQVIFTGNGTEADNLALYGPCTRLLTNCLATGKPCSPAPRILVSAIEHPAVLNTARSLADFGFDVREIPIDACGQIKQDAYHNLLTPETVLISIMQVNNITGTILPVADLAQQAKRKVPNVWFHSDIIQGFGRLPMPASDTDIDMVSISAHKLKGPKGIGALVCLNPACLKPNGLRPIIHGGGQENRIRSGTPNPGLIAAFRIAAEEALANQQQHMQRVLKLQQRFRDHLKTNALLNESGGQGPLRWNSPETAVPHIVSLSAPGYDTGPLTRLLEERDCVVATGSACGSKQPGPDHVLTAMGCNKPEATASLRISLDPSLTFENVKTLAEALQESIQVMNLLHGPRK